MLMNAPATFIQSYIDDLNDALNQLKPGAALTRIQAAWLGTCLTCILLMNSVCWAKFERASLGDCKVAALSWVFRKASIPWDWLLRVSVVLILKRYGITEGVLAFDESDRARSKSTKRIYKVYKQKHKGSGGYVNGQTIVLLLLVTSSITVPVGFFFYMPDPALKQWDKEDKRLKKSGIAKKDRPIKPERDSAYPTKTEIALGLLKEFKVAHSLIKIKGVLADALYGEKAFMDEAAKESGGSQVISQLRKNQKIEYRGRIRSVESYFNSINKGIDQIIRVRGGKEIKVTVSSARLKVSSHSKKRFVIALKYDGENDYRYLVATDLTWRTQDIIQAYTLRWLIEVFFEDWKLYEGWGREAKQLDEEGSSRGLILSLLFDHCLLLHPEQIARIESKLPAYTVGSLQRKSQMDVLLEFITSLLEFPDPGDKLKELGELIKDVFQLLPSGKHMIGRDLGRLGPTASLKYCSTG
ncbi:transposase, IS701 family [Bathymodiolus japonicus methanotrophic gill symbiont]|uniref:transposase n=1 Tax=Bathymodiolus japonicus methanotrophic gill symbiont TaxID=113269 RepID=UPI001B4BE6AA|nr:transposase [Bathymodiolus japonicus methanotrophic gill symbiont]GFO73087.1 transposase, IS701 family [Bathymodiolus japonicus methanotrophic gill symbiont]